MEKKAVMKTEIFMHSNNNDYEAKGSYNDGIVTVHAGSRISRSVATHIKKKSYVFLLREDSNIVDSDGIVLKECHFGAPSPAAQFVSGRMINGYIAWQVAKRLNLRKWLTQQKNN